MKKAFFILILIILIIFVCFIANKRNTPPNGNSTVVFWTLQLSTFDKYITNIISEFEEQNPGIKVKWIDIPYAEGEKRTLAAVLTDNPPDLINTTPDFSLMLAGKNALYTIDEKYLEQFIPSIKKSLKYNSQYFGIPFYATSAVTLYNKELTKQIPALPQTYDDLFKIDFKNNGNNYLTMINFAENDTLLKILNKYDINSAQTINTEKSISIFKEFKKLFDNNEIPKESITQTHRDALEKFMAGQLAFIVTGANFINMIRENAPAVYKNTGILPQLTGSTNAYDYSCMNFIIPKKAQNKEAALKFALFFTNKENQLEFARLTPILPVNKEALNDEFFYDKTFTSQKKSDNEYFKHVSNSNSDLSIKSRMISAYQLNKLQPPLSDIKNKKELNTISSNYIQQILINNAPIKETLDKFSHDWEKL